MTPPPRRCPGCLREALNRQPEDTPEPIGRVRRLGSAYRALRELAEAYGVSRDDSANRARLDILRAAVLRFAERDEGFAEGWHEALVVLREDVRRLPIIGHGDTVFRAAVLALLPPTEPK